MHWPVRSRRRHASDARDRPHRPRRGHRPTVLRGRLPIPCSLALPTARSSSASRGCSSPPLRGLGTNMVSDYPSTVSLLYHTPAPVLAVLAAATIIALGARAAPYRVAAAPGRCSGLAVVVLVATAPAPGRRATSLPPRVIGRVAALEEAVGLFRRPRRCDRDEPTGRASVRTPRRTPLPARACVEGCPRCPRPVEHDGEPGSGRSPFDPLERLDRDASWRLVFDREGVRVYRNAPHDRRRGRRP